ncbi:MAG: hypothetical protein Q4B62_05460 [Clostridiaceae bacterium]|nr:hypothetical protein [Clostridiaceae bacterium]
MFKYKKLYKAATEANEKILVKNQKLKETIEEMAASAQKLNDEISNLEKQLVNKQIDLDTLRAHNEAIRKELSDMKAEDINRKKLLDDLSSSRMNWMKQAEEHGKAYTKARSSLKKANKEIEDLKDSISLLIKENEDRAQKLISISEGANALKGVCSGCINEGNYRKCSSCVRGHAKDKYSPIPLENLSSEDDTDSGIKEDTVKDDVIAGKAAEPEVPIKKTDVADQDAPPVKPAPEKGPKMSRKKKKATKKSKSK